ncbi:MAG: porin [Thermodesulfobacteriota bacterium]
MNSALMYLSRVIIFSCVFLLITIAHAQTDKQEIEELKKRIEAIQLENQRQIQELKQEIERLDAELTAETNDNVVANDNNLDPEQGGESEWFRQFRAAYDRGLRFQSEDGNYRMRFRILGQFQLSVNDTEGELTSTSFDIRRLRLIWDGNAFKPWLLYRVGIDATVDDILTDMYFTAAYINEIAPRVGQFKVPFYREFLTSAAGLQLVERSIVNREFSLDRDIGVSILGGFTSGYHISYLAGVFNGDGRNGTSVDSNLMYVGRIQLGLGGDGGRFNANNQFPAASDYSISPNFASKPTFVAGAAIATMPGLNCDRKSPGGGACARIAELGFPQSDFTTFTTDVNFKTDWFSIEAEYAGRWIAPETGPMDTSYDQGFNLQGGVFILANTIEVAGRYSLIDYDTSAGVIPAGMIARDTMWAVTPGLNYYISHDHRLKIQLDYSFLRNTFTNQSPHTDENLLRLQLSAFF